MKVRLMRLVTWMSRMAVLYLTPSHRRSFLITLMNLGSIVRSIDVFVMPTWGSINVRIRTKNQKMIKLV